MNSGKIGKFINWLLACFMTTMCFGQNVGIGVLPDVNYKLDVNGTIHARNLVNSVNGFSINGYNVLRQDNFGNTFIGVENPGVAGGQSSQYNTIVGAGAAAFSSSINGNTVIGRLANYDNSFTNYSSVFGTGAFSNSFGCAFGSEARAAINSVAFGANASAFATNSIAIGYLASTSTANSIRLGNNDIAFISAKVGLTVTSDKNQKENFVSYNSEEILAELVEIPVSSWSFVNDTNRHYGPMAQDFYAAFGRDGYGTIGSDTTINTHDLTSINTLAIQALEKRSRKYEVLERENERLKQELLILKATLVEENAKLRELLHQLSIRIDLSLNK